ncbi:MAG TPA: class I tRNA ligase family protein, partial [Geothrix sp.]|nr:class I tRNA ligase family protein [Geothrix sp.]
ALLAPVMSFTADEAWEQIPGVEGSVHEQRFPEGSASELDLAWEKLWNLRSEIQAKSEPLRSSKDIGTSLDAAVTLRVNKVERERLQSLGESLDDLFVVSNVEFLVPDVPEPTNVNGHIAFHAEVNVTPDTRTKCPRCWNHKGGHGRGEDAALCARCATVVG